eukprot:3491505-Rhodomonas_salina.2
MNGTSMMPSCPPTLSVSRRACASCHSASRALDAAMRKRAADTRTLTSAERVVAQQRRLVCALSAPASGRR